MVRLRAKVRPFSSYFCSFQYGYGQMGFDGLFFSPVGHPRTNMNNVNSF